MKHVYRILLLVGFSVIAANVYAQGVTREDLSSACTDHFQRSGAANLLCVAESIDKRVLVDDVVQYTFSVLVGPQPQDKIRIHRVVREVNGKPITNASGLFLTHGDAFGFNQVYLNGAASPSGSPEHSFAVFLAQRDLDVWGIDLRWVLVPEDTTDFAFMRGWNMKEFVGDIARGLLIARVARFATGSGFGKLHLIGWSSGAMLNYAYMDFETQLRPAFRQAQSLVAMDTFYKLGPEFEQFRQNSCARLPILEGQFNAGTYIQDNRLFPVVGQLAQSDPNGASPILPGLTNLQAAWFAGGLFYQLEEPYPTAPFFHQVTATFDAATGLPNGLRFSETDRWLDLLLLVRPFQSLAVRIDIERVVCGETPSEHADALAKIKVPTLYVSTAGGFGNLGNHMLTLLGSTEKVIHDIQFESEANRLHDFGHSDLFVSEVAPALGWERVAQWVLAH